MSFDTAKKLASNFLGCDIDECLYICDEDGAYKFEEPYGGTCLVYNNGTII